MLKHRPVAIFFCALVFATFFIGRFVSVTPLIYLCYAVIWSSVLFCGCYFIGLNYFSPSVCFADTQEKMIALSFDDGPHDATPGVLDILKEKQVQAIFFCIGKNIPGRENILRRIVAEGHIIGNHSFSHHPLFDLFPTKKMFDDVETMSDATQEIIKQRPVLFRPPFGVTNPTVARVIKKGGYTCVGWNLRSYDTMKKDPTKLKAKISSGLNPGGIVLLHDSAPVTLQTLPALIDEIRAAGYSLRRLDKMCNLTPYA